MNGPGGPSAVDSYGKQAADGNQARLRFEHAGVHALDRRDVGEQSREQGFAIVPEEGQTLFMVSHILVRNLAHAAGAFLAGLLLTWIPGAMTRPFESLGLGRAANYRVLFLLAAALYLGVAAMTRILRDLKEVSARGMLADVRVRARRRLVSLLTGGPRAPGDSAP